MNEVADAKTNVTDKEENICGKMEGRGFGMVLYLLFYQEQIKKECVRK